MAEVHAGLEQLLHGDDCHVLSFRFLGETTPAGGERNQAVCRGTTAREFRRGAGMGTPE